MTSSSGDLQTLLEDLTTGSDSHDPRARQQAAVLAFGRRATSRTPIAELMEDAVSLVGEILGGDWHGIGEVTADGSQLRVQISPSGPGHGPAETISRPCPLQPEASMAGYAVHLARLLLVEDLGREDRFHDPLLAPLGVRSGLAVPLILDQRVFGVLGVYARAERAFTREDGHFAETIAHMLVSSVGRFHAEEELKRVRKVAEEATHQLDALRAERDKTPPRKQRAGEADTTRPATGDWDRTARALAPPRPFQPVGGNAAAEMRSSPRRSYQYHQSIAPIYGGCIPARKEFYEVPCRDISAGGIAFYLPGRPDFDSLVVALGRAPSQSYFTAKVVRTEEIERHRKKQFLVGCRFSGRIQI